MEALILALTPVFISGVTQITKYVTANIARLNPAVLRIIVAVLSYLLAVANAGLTGEPVDPMAVETFTSALVNFFAATGVYLLARRS